jgi:hypothetical protein
MMSSTIDQYAELVPRKDLHQHDSLFSLTLPESEKRLRCHLWLAPMSVYTPFSILDSNSRLHLS